MICWYCYWGWPKQVADIYLKYADLIGDWAALDFGPGHIAWSDENFDDGSIQFCIDYESEFRMDECFAAGAGVSQTKALRLTVESLRELLAVPEDIRCCEPEGYDGEHPENFPPPDGIQMVRIDKWRLKREGGNG